MNTGIREDGFETPAKPPQGSVHTAAPRAVFIFGPTAVGKSSTIQHIYREFPQIELLSADSMQVYRGMDIGSAKPSGVELSEFPHHFINIRNPDEGYNVSDFVGDANRVITEVNNRGGLPVVSGGTAFYFKHLWFGMPESPPSREDIREELKRECQTRGLAALRSDLEEIDPESFGRIGAGDEYRILRALEVYRCSGRPLSSFPVPDSPRPDINALVIGLHRERSELYARINERVEQMFALGLENELRRLIAQGWTADNPGMKGIGYREFTEAERYSLLASGRQLPDNEREIIIGEIQQASRRYAKRQLTFFRSLPSVQWIDAEDKQLIIKKIQDFFL